MKAIVKKIFIVVVAGLVSSCFNSRPIVSEAPKNNQTYRVDYLFEHDGCKVYRFYDDWAGAYVYFTNCSGDVVSIKNDSTKNRVRNSVSVTYENYNTSK